MEIDRIVPVAMTSEVAPGQMKVCSAGRFRIALCHVGESFYAIEDVCTHDDGPLGEGTLQGDCVECPRHGARFDVKTGAVLRMPAIAPVKVFPVQVRDGQVFVEVPL